MGLFNPLNPLSVYYWSRPFESGDQRPEDVKEEAPKDTGGESGSPVLVILLVVGFLLIVLPLLIHGVQATQYDPKDFRPIISAGTNAVGGNVKPTVTTVTQP